jgi:serine protease Do
MTDFPSLLVQIATPYSTGTGFYFHENGWIVTSEHIVRDSQKVVVDRPGYAKQIGEVFYLDSKTDIALLRVPKPDNIPTIQVHTEALKKGQPIKITNADKTDLVKSGLIVDGATDIEGVTYFSHDVVLDRNDHGGLIWSDAGTLLGMSTSIGKGGMGLPVYYLTEALAWLEKRAGRTACRCYKCATIAYDDSSRGDTCPSCGEEIQLPALIPPYQPVGVAATIEHLLSELVAEVALTRRGPYSWQVEQGSAEINISYYEKNGLIVGDAHLCTLPEKDNEALYTYLLQQNYAIENLTFSIQNEDIVLSLVIYDRYLNESSGQNLFQHLFAQADTFDNLLVENYGALWKKAKISSEQI